MTSRDQLFLLAPGFIDRDRREYCPECAEMWGLLHYYPAIRDSLDIHYQPLSHPRPGLVARLGRGRWNCPTLILAAGADAGPHAHVETAKGERFIASARQIGVYFAHRFGTAWPRGVD